jgi:hypothetical protein
MRQVITFNQNPGLFVGSDDTELAQQVTDDPTLVTAYCDLATERIMRAYPDAEVRYEQDEWQPNWVRTSPPSLQANVEEILTETYQDTDAWASHP